jgi:ABC-type Na+ efflux pump permease subunit
MTELHKSLLAPIVLALGQMSDSSQARDQIDLQSISATLQRVLQENTTPLYKDAGFWISTILGALGVLISYVAYSEAKKAKEAAKEAATFVKVQTITIELTEILQRLDQLDINISYSSARDFYNEINRRIRRLVAPYEENNLFNQRISDIYLCLDEVKTSLANVKPYRTGEDDLDAGNSVYYAVESEFSTLSGKLAGLTGLFEQGTVA